MQHKQQQQQQMPALPQNQYPPPPTTKSGGASLPVPVGVPVSVPVLQFTPASKPGGVAAGVKVAAASVASSPVPFSPPPGMTTHAQYPAGNEPPEEGESDRSGFPLSPTNAEYGCGGEEDGELGEEGEGEGLGDEDGDEEGQLELHGGDKEEEGQGEQN